MISSIARAVISTLTVVKDSLVDVWATIRKRDSQRESKSSSTESPTSETFTPTGTIEKILSEESKLAQWISGNKSSPSVMYDLTDHQGPRVVMSGQRVIVEFINDPIRSYSASRMSNGLWYEDDPWQSMIAQPMQGALEQLYAKYLNEIMTREFG